LTGKNSTEENKDSFEVRMARIEEIIRALESGKAPLDESLALYEEGVKLISGCSSMLDEAERKIKLLSKRADGTVEEKDFIPDDK
jgi:exodeoxyribonuclease VII small subunit